MGEFGLKTLEILTEVGRPSEVTKARVKPKSKLVAVRCGGAHTDIHILDLENEQTSKEPLLILSGHQSEGFGLEWNKIKSSHLVSAGSDRKVCVWDIEAQQEEPGTLKPVVEFVFHSMGVEDASWSWTNPDILVTCGQDKLVAM